jgi:hypothetical protein
MAPGYLWDIGQTVHSWDGSVQCGAIAAIAALPKIHSEVSVTENAIVKLSDSECYGASKAT